LHLFNLQESITLRLITSFLCISIGLYPKLSNIIKRKYFPYYWHITLVAALPLSISYLTLINNSHDMWLWWMIFMPIILAIFIPGWFMYIMDLTIGMLLAFLIYKIFYGNIILRSDISYLQFTLVFSFSVITAIIFVHYNRKTWLTRQHRKLTLLAASIANEMQNPINSINLISDNLQPNENNIRYSQNSIKNITILADNIIEMSLNKVMGKNINKDDFTYFKAQESVIEALTIYGYQNEKEKNKLKIDFGNKNFISAKNMENEIFQISDNQNFIFKGIDNAFKYILFNLIRNSFIYSKNVSDLEIIISFEKDVEIEKNLINKFNLNSDIKRYNVISVTDNGNGISKNDIARIFDSYQDSINTDRMGLGLNFCKRTMEDFGGTIICKSEFGKWTKFSLLFPILTDAENIKAAKIISKIEDEKKKKIEIIEGISKIEKSLKKKNSKNILLVDDSRLNIEIIAKELRGKCPDFDVTIMNDPIKAFNLIKFKHQNDDQFDLILTDIDMPAMDGKELVKKIREDLDLSKDILPILAYTSIEDIDSINKMKELGVNAYYTKPKDLHFITRNISKWMLGDYVPNKNVKYQDIIINSKTLKNLNVIIADDQSFNLSLISKKFFDVGANINQCKDGEGIVELIKENPKKYHLIITDIHMNKINGIEAVKEIRKIQNEYNETHNTNYKIPIIAMSSDSDKSIVIKALNNGIDDYITKERNPNDLIKLSKFWVDYRLDINKNPTIEKCQTILKYDFTSLFSSEEEASQIVDIFELESKEIISEIKKYKHDIENLWKPIHKLKGTSGSIGAIKLFEYLSEIHNLIKNVKKIEDEYFDQKIERIFKDSIKEMKKEIIDKF